MKNKPFTLISGIVFTILCLAHGLRMIQMWPLHWNGHELPMILNMPLMLLFALLASLCFQRLMPD